MAAQFRLTVDGIPHTSRFEGFLLEAVLLFNLLIRRSAAANLAIEMAKLAVPVEALWRRLTPSVTGRLRLSEHVFVVVNLDSQGNIDYRPVYKVVGPAQEYYGRVSRAHAAIRGEKVPREFFRRHRGAAVERAVERAFVRAAREAGFLL